MKKIKWADIMFFFLLIGCGVLTFLYITSLEESKILSEKLVSQTERLANTKARDSLFTKNNKEYSKIITKYVDGTTFTIDGKNYTSDDLLKLWIDADTKNSQLQYELDNCKENLKKTAEVSDKAIDMAKKINEQAVNVNKENRQHVKDYNELIKKNSPSKFREYEYFYTTAKRVYGMDYAVENITDSTRTLVFKASPRIDSAIMIYKAYQQGDFKGINQIKREDNRRKNKN